MPPLPSDSRTWYGPRRDPVASGIGYFVGTRLFSSSVQFNTTVIAGELLGDAESPAPMSFTMRNRWASSDTSYVRALKPERTRYRPASKIFVGLPCTSVEPDASMDTETIASEASMKNTSCPLCAQTGLRPPAVDTCHLPPSTLGNGRT